ncbi:sensor histidine kinase [Lentisalinibacter salinarum]|uniref:sensor histidine kinase n=1 Tax=Lentisalinibacter salinarum TaxID=2992239 RepID=UPI0038678552
MATTEEQVRGSHYCRKDRRERDPAHTPGTTTSQPVPELVLLLDGEARIVRWTGPHPGPRLGQLPLRAGMTIHDALHPGCSRQACRLATAFSEAWETHRSGLPVEWLFASTSLDGVLKLRLQSVAYVCGALFGEAVTCYESHSVLFMHDITAGYRAAERDENPSWRAVRQDETTAPLVQRFLPVGSPVLEPAPDARLTGLTARLLVAQEAEQKRLAAELHDGLGQSLSILRFEIEGCLDGDADPAQAAATLARAADYVRRSQEELRRITSNLGPVALKKHGLSGSLELLCLELLAACPDLEVRCSLDGRDHQVSEQLAVAIYRIAQEALNNVASHARATRVKLRFRTLDDAVELRIVDDGVGLPLNNGDRREGLGLSTMRERTEALGGRFSLVSAPGKGCQIRVRWGTAAFPSLR